MKRFGKYLSLLLAAVMLTAAFPALAEGGVTRAYAVYSFVEAVGEDNFSRPAGDLSAFGDGNDVPQEYRDEMALAVGNGVIQGSGGSLRPNDELSRLEAMLILGRCLPAIDEARPGTRFTDVPDWAETEIDRLYRAGIVNGYGDGRLGADDRVSMEQLALLTGRVRAAFPGEADLKDDFYSAVNKDYIASAQLGGDRADVSLIRTRDDAVADYLISRSDGLLSAYTNGGGLNLVESRAARFYQIALYGGTAENNPIAPLNKYIDRIDACDTLLDLARACGTIFSDVSAPTLFNVSTLVRMRSEMPEAVSGVYIDFVGSGIDKSYWAADPEGVRADYEAYAAELLSLAGIRASAADLAGLSALQRDVALAGMSMSEYYAAGGDDGVQHVFNWKELSGMYTGKWKNPITAMLFALDSKEITGLNGYIIADRGMTDKAVELVNTAELSVVKTLCKVNLLTQMSDFLPQPYRDAANKLYREVMGFASPVSTKEHAARLTASVFSDAYEQDYVNNRTQADTEFLKTMTQDIIDVFKRKFVGSQHISPKTAAAAADKLDRIESVICGYDEATDDPGDYFDPDSERSLLANGVKMMEDISGGYFSTITFVDTAYPSYTPNASYNLYLNRIDIYAGILFAPIYSPSASYEENLGGIGAVIAHELSHAFDGNGSMYNGAGNYEPWWSDSDYEYFDSFVDRLNAYYGSYCSSAGNPVDGGLTSDENIADLLAMDCVITLAKEKGLDLDKVFRAYAASWAEACTPEYDLNQSRCDSHAPNKVRVNAVLSCFDEFYELYGVTEGDGMYVPPEERVRFF